MDLVEPFKELDTKLVALDKLILYLNYVNPIEDDSHNEAKERFLRREIDSPTFSLPPFKPEYDPERVHQALFELVVPDGMPQLVGIYRGKLETLRRLNQICRDREKPGVVRQITQELFGIPSPELMDLAKRVLAETSAVDEEKNIPESRIKQALEAELSHYRLDQGSEPWTVEYYKKKPTQTLSQLRKIQVCEKHNFSANALLRLPKHEVGVHALRGENGHQHTLKVLSTGIDGYLGTEEGLAAYVEKRLGLQDAEVLRGYAGRVLAADSVLQNASFRETFDLLKNHDFTDTQAWGTTVRAHRAGGFIKDHEYLRGLQLVQDYAKRGGDFKVLWVGKIGVQHVPVVRELLEANVLREPVHLPDFLPQLS